MSGILSHPILLTYLFATIEGTEEISEASNAENDGKIPCSVSVFYSGGNKNCLMAITCSSQLYSL